MEHVKEEVERIPHGCFVLCPHCNAEIGVIYTEEKGYAFACSSCLVASNKIICSDGSELLLVFVNSKTN